ncbi:thymidylate synthase [Streptosporangium sp. NBC_01755]|uniref:thymidylate synthase n=1 Tax=unclassified Streptosporangium TaxID=2632669 RepID=UPI002DDB9355|nr:MULTISPECIES: thymidylate synthase [unclassified Streptosporangium]WSA26649.1 thymidylate synthase [Streptosporangium sp. NBC_01810]WSD01927.1 thymidylate synthase [Streptosporangium sp. NBC_01755]
MMTLTADSVAGLFGGTVALTMNGGRSVSPRGMATREVLDVNLRLTRPRARLLLAPPARILNPAFAIAETVWILSGSDDPWIFDFNGRLRQFADGGVLRGAYGPRMRRWGGRIDQLARVIETLKADPDSRRAVVQLYDPAQDTAGHRDVPCTLGFRFHLRQGRLHMSTTMRGQDVWVGLPYDLFFTTTLHELMAGWLEAELGDYHHHVDSLHIYERDIDQAATLRAIPETPELPAMTAPWHGFETLLARTRAGELTGHPGWDTAAEVLHSYRLWKSGDRVGAQHLADQARGPLGEALRAWYEELRSRATATAGTR